MKWDRSIDYYLFINILNVIMDLYDQNVIQYSKEEERVKSVGEAGRNQALVNAF